MIQKIMNEVKSAYNEIAEPFSHSRHAIWPELLPILDYIKDGDSILDLGCGNGRILKLFNAKLINYTGLDPSDKLIALAKELHPNGGLFMVGGADKLPFPDASFDHILMIAVLHHIPDRAFRQRVLLEIKRVLRPGGMLFLTNWNRWRPRFIWNIIKGLFVPGFDFGDCYIPWDNKVERYYHAFTRRGLRRELEKAGFTILKHTVENNNFVTFCQKA